MTYEATTTLHPNDLDTINEGVLPESLKHRHILFIDDDEGLIKLILGILEQSGFDNVDFALGGEEALEKLKLRHWDLVLVDLNMPFIDGIDVCYHIRSDATLMHIPVIFLSGTNSPKERSRIFEAGASDLIHKPYEETEIIMRIIMHLERYVMFQEMHHFREKMEKELQHAKTMQAILYPNNELLQKIRQTYGQSIARYEQSSSDIGGDMWGVFPVDSQSMALYIADFTGHGMAAALNTFRLQALIHSIGAFHEPIEFVNRLNTDLYKLLQRGDFATFMFLKMDVIAHTISFIPAASPSPLLIRANGSVETLDSRGFPLGIQKDEPYQSITLSYSAGDCLLLYSDALIESPRRSTGTFFDEQSLIEFISSHNVDEKNIHTIVDALMKEVRTPNGEVIDDLTLVMVHFSEQVEEILSCDIGSRARYSV